MEGAAAAAVAVGLPEPGAPAEAARAAALVAPVPAGEHKGSVGVIYIAICCVAFVSAELCCRFHLLRPVAPAEAAAVRKEVRAVAGKAVAGASPEAAEAAEKAETAVKVVGAAGAVVEEGQVGAAGAGAVSVSAAGDGWRLRRMLAL